MLVNECKHGYDIQSDIFRTKIFYQSACTDTATHDQKCVHSMQMPIYDAFLRGGRVVLGKLPVPGHPTIWMIVGQGPTALAVGAGEDCLDIFTLLYPFSPLSPSLWERA